MNYQFSISTVSKYNSNQFYRIFSRVLQTEFPGYAPEVVTYLLTEIYHPRAIDYWIERKEKDIYISLENGQITGFAMIDVPYGGVSFCRWLGVLKKYQRKGVGTALIAAWEQSAREKKAHKMEVAGQPEAKQFYEKTDFTLEGTRKQSYFGIDQYLFGKIIGSPSIQGMINK